MNCLSKIAFFLLFFLSLKTQAQNLVSNGSFEEYSDCPVQVGQLELCNDWFIPNKSTPEFLRNCDGISISTFGSPYNLAGVQESHTGQAHAGFFLLDFNRYKSREYIQGKLVAPLQKGTKYSVTFYISLADFAFFPTDRIGYKFTRNKLKPKFWNRVEKAIKKSDGKVHFPEPLLADRDSWYKLSFEYVAKGGEKFITFGIFQNDLTETEFELLKKKKFLHPRKVQEYSYYYFDNVSIEPVNDSGSNTLGTSR